RTVRASLEPTVTLSGLGRARFYSTGERQLTLQSRAGFNVQLARPLTFNVQDDYRDVWGGTPFYCDRVSPQESATLRLNWRTAAVTASASATYNFQIGRAHV